MFCACEIAQLFFVVRTAHKFEFSIVIDEKNCSYSDGDYFLDRIYVFSANCHSKYYPS